MFTNSVTLIWDYVRIWWATRRKRSYFLRHLHSCHQLGSSCTFSMYFRQNMLNFCKVHDFMFYLQANSYKTSRLWCYSAAVVWWANFRAIFTKASLGFANYILFLNTQSDLRPWTNLVTRGHVIRFLLFRVVRGRNRFIPALAGAASRPA